MPAGENSAVHPDSEWQCGNIEKARLAVCIPAHAELAIAHTLNSLAQCEPLEGTAVFISVNASEADVPEVRNRKRQTFEEIRTFAAANGFPYPLWVGLYEDLPAKKAGVGLARKLAMDKACAVLHRDAVLLCLDADCRVSSNYLTGTKAWFDAHPKAIAASLYFEHPEPADTGLREGIRQYELHLRYLKQSLKWAGYPWYYHTVGSAMAVRAQAYLKNGGMNQRQAGEDFYFLHKLMPLGFGEIADVAVYPEARISHRVPFGTGRSMAGFITEGRILTYAPATFTGLKQMFDTFHEEGMSGLLKSAGTNPVIAHFLEEGMEDAWHEAVAHTSVQEAARRRFYKWFSGFRMVRCLNAMRQVYEDVPVDAAAREMAAQWGWSVETVPLELYYRELDRRSL